MKEFNHDEFEFDEDNASSYFFAELYYRLDNHQVVHSRVKTQFDRILLAPIISLCVTVFLIQRLFLGKFMKYLKLISMIRHVYHLDENLEPENQKNCWETTPQSTFFFFMMFLKGQSMMNVLLNNSCCMSKEQRAFNLNYVRYKKRLKADLDLKFMMK